jgi:catechol 2,3-dioxygenase-like lactoylglutathione lyase family enzyme
MATLGYCTVGSNYLEKAKAFYDSVLATAGMTPLREHASGGRVYGQAGNACFVVLGAFDGQPASVGNGTMCAFRCDTREEVQAIHAKALSLGGKDEGAPGERRPGMYFSYFRDLDGNKLCAYSIG